MLVVAAAEWVEDEFLDLGTVGMAEDYLLPLIYLRLIPMIHNRYIPATLNLLRHPPTLISLPQTLHQNPNLLCGLFRPYLLNDFTHIILTSGIDKPKSVG